MDLQEFKTDGSGGRASQNLPTIPRRNPSAQGTLLDTSATEGQAGAAAPTRASVTSTDEPSFLNTFYDDGNDADSVSDNIFLTLAAQEPASTAEMPVAFAATPNVQDPSTTPSTPPATQTPLTTTAPVTNSSQDRLAADPGGIPEQITTQPYPGDNALLDGATTLPSDHPTANTQQSAPATLQETPLSTNQASLTSPPSPPPPQSSSTVGKKRTKLKLHNNTRSTRLRMTALASGGVRVKNRGDGFDPSPCRLDQIPWELRTNLVADPYDTKQNIAMKNAFMARGKKLPGQKGYDTGARLRPLSKFPGIERLAVSVQAKRDIEYKAKIEKDIAELNFNPRVATMHTDSYRLDDPDKAQGGDPTPFQWKPPKNFKIFDPAEFAEERSQKIEDANLHRWRTSEPLWAAVPEFLEKPTRDVGECD